MGKLKFGVFLPFYGFPENSGKTFDEIRYVASECARLDFDSVWLDDHLMLGDWPVLESWTALSSLAALTGKVRLGTMVSSVAHRNPALLAKQAAALDVISGGRLEFGVGAGVGEAEHLAYGFDYPKGRVRVERLAEALEVIRLLWTQNKASYEGKHFQLRDAVCLPKPVQKPHPPVIVGGCGNLLLRKATAPFANRSDFGYLPTREQYKAKLMELEKACREVGRDFGEIEKMCWPGGQVIIAKNQEELEEKIKQKNVLGLSVEEFKKTALVGTPQQCIEQIQAYAGLGASYFMLYFSDLPCLDGLRLFAQEVLQALQV